MKIQLIRNATMKINYAGKTILTDPMLSEKYSIRSFAGISKNPTVDLPFDAQKVIENVDCVLISHTHPDHFDQKAVELLNKDIDIFCQPANESELINYGFSYVTSIENTFVWNKITFIKTNGKHGSGAILEKMGIVSGFVLQSENEPTVYWVGDSVLCDDVENTIKKYKPDIIITHSGGAVIPGFNPILMDDKETLALYNFNHDAKIIAIHTESLDHCTITRDKILQSAINMNIDLSKLIIPKDGEIISL